MRWLVLLLLTAAPTAAETLVATRTIRPPTVLTAADVAVLPSQVAGALASPVEAIGLEARVVLYGGRPIHATDLGPPAIVERNQPVLLRYDLTSLSIAVEGRALMRGGAGEVIRVMNVASRSTVPGRVAPDGSVRVPPTD